MYAYLPAEVDSLLHSLPYSNSRKKSARVNDLRFLLSQLYLKHAEAESDAPIPLCSVVLQKYVREPALAWRSLIEAGIVRRHEYPRGYLWRSGLDGECSLYSLRSDLCNSSAQRYALPDKFRRVLSAYISEQNSITERDAGWSIPLRDAMQLMSFDCDSAWSYLEANKERYSELQYLHRCAVIDVFYSKELPFYYRENCGRLFTPISNLPKEFRRFIRVPGVELVECDIRNSQPFFLCAEVKRLEGNCDALADACEGLFYERIAEGLSIPLDEVKSLSLKVIYDVPREYLRGNWKEVSEALARVYPQLWEYVVRYKMERSNKDLALSMQRYEGEVILQQVASALCDGNTFVATIHDSIILPEVWAGECMSLIKAVCLEKYGCSPNVRVKKI